MSNYFIIQYYDSEVYISKTIKNEERESNESNINLDITYLANSFGKSSLIYDHKFPKAMVIAQNFFA